MITIKVFNDLHVGSPHEIVPSYNIFAWMLLKNKETTFFLGDIYDILGCKKERVDYYKNLSDGLEENAVNYVSGNHELNQDKLTKIVDKTLFIHGDLIFYSDEKFYSFRQQEFGSPWYIRMCLKPIDWYRLNIRRPFMDDTILEKASKLLDTHNCTRLICGHSHRKKSSVYNLPNGKQLVVLARGEHDITLDLSHIEKEIIIKDISFKG